MIADPVVFNAHLANPKRRMLFHQSRADSISIWRAFDNHGRYVVVNLFGHYAAYALPYSGKPCPLPNFEKMSESIGMPLFETLDDAINACEDWRDKQKA